MKKYLKNSFAELQKVTWPSQETSVKMTIITIIFTVLVTLLITFLDKGFNYGYQTLLDFSPTTYETETPIIEPGALEVNAETASGDAVNLEVSTPESSETTDAQ